MAVPVAPRSSVEDLQKEADELVWFFTPEPLDGVGRWNQDFSQTTDQEVRDLANRATNDG